MPGKLVLVIDSQAVSHARSAKMQSVAADVAMPVSVCVSVTAMSCTKMAKQNQDAIWGVDLGMPEEPFIR